MPKVSVVIPAYNAARFIRGAVESVCVQTLTDWELIVVDDFSADNTVEIVEELAVRDGRISLIRRKSNSGGAMVPRMEGFSHASSPLVVGLDADDFLSADYLEQMLDCRNRTGASIVCPGISFAYPDESVRPYLPVDDFDATRNYVGRDLVINTLDGWKIGMSGALMEREAVCGIYKNFEIQGHRTNYPFGDELLSRFFLAGAKIVAFCPDATYFYRMNADSVTHSINEAYFSRLELFKELSCWVSGEYGTGSEEYSLVQKMSFLAVIESMRAIDSLTEADAKSRVNKLIRRNYSLIDFPVVKPQVSRGLYLVMQTGPRISRLIFGLHKQIMRRFRPDLQV